MKKIVFPIITVLIVLAGCSTTALKRYYELHIPAAIRVESPAIPAQVLLSSTIVNQIYQDNRLVYRFTPFQLDYYNYEYWAKKPGTMIHDLLFGYFRHRNTFAHIFTSLTEGQPEFIIRPRILSMEEVDKSKFWYGHLEMAIDVYNFASKKIVFSHYFNRLSRLVRKDTRLLAKVLSDILEDELQVFVKKFRSHFQENQKQE